VIYRTWLFALSMAVAVQPSESRAQQVFDHNAFGLTSKAPDWAPEIGVMFSFR
jgi:hypothetical protein